MGAGKVVNAFYQSARYAVQTVINTILPFMALLIGIIQGSGVGDLLAKVMSPLVGTGLGLVLIGFICFYHHF